MLHHSNNDTKITVGLILNLFFNHTITLKVHLHIFAITLITHNSYFHSSTQKFTYVHIVLYAMCNTKTRVGD